MTTVLVLGGRGFIGRHAVRALRKRGCQVVIGTRHLRRGRSLEDFQVTRVHEVHLERMCEPARWALLLEGVDVVINCVGILRERRAESWLSVHRDAPLALYQACATARVSHLIHISALGLRADASSGFITSKLLGEAALERAASDAVALSIVRPSLLEGADGFGSRWLRWMARLPVLFMPKALGGKLAVLDVDDLADALSVLAVRPAQGLAFEELGGEERRTMIEHIAALRRARGERQALVVPMPLWMAQLAARLCDLLHFSPFSLGHLELMCYDNLPKGRRLAELLQHEPRAIGVDKRKDAGRREALLAAR